MKLLPLLVLLCLTLNACAVDANGNPMPANVKIGADALLARETASVAQSQAQVAQAQAQAAQANAQIAAANATAARQVTLDAQNGKATDAANALALANITATYVAISYARADVQKTENAQAQAQAETETAEKQQQQTRGAETLESRQATKQAIQTSTHIAEQNATATATAQVPTQIAIQQQMSDDANRRAHQLQEENDRADREKWMAPLRDILGLCALIVIVAGIIAGIFIMGYRYLIGLESRQRIIPQTNGTFLFLAPGNFWGSNPQPRIITERSSFEDPFPRMQTIPPSAPTPTLALPPSAPTPTLALPPPPPPPFTFPVLDLDEYAMQGRRSALDVPIGVTAQHPLGWWLSITDLDTVLIGASRGSGKTNLLQTWIDALTVSRSARLVLYDGKRGNEFNRYQGLPKVQIVDDAFGPVLGDLGAEMAQRMEMFRTARVSNITDYNEVRGSGGRLSRIILFVDELARALQEDDVLQPLTNLLALGRAYGIHAVCATQYPSADVVRSELKVNLVTRIALRVPSAANSRVILDQSGAEDLETVGRLLIVWQGKLVEAQALHSVARAYTPTPNATPPPTNPILDVRELAVARVVRDQFNGVYIQNAAFLKATGEGKSYLNNLAQKWEMLGYLTAVQKTERGQNAGRHITEKLRSILAASA